jgi:hypothetical protein
VRGGAAHGRNARVRAASSRRAGGAHAPHRVACLPRLTILPLRLCVRQDCAEKVAEKDFELRQQQQAHAAKQAALTRRGDKAQQAANIVYGFTSATAPRTRR